MNKIKLQRRWLNAGIGGALASLVVGLGTVLGTYVTYAARTYLTDDRIVLLYSLTLLSLYLICSLTLSSVATRRLPMERL
jgi:hypothetical protein